MIAAAAAALALQPFRYERTLAPGGPAAVVFVVDAPMLAHARADFSDVRVVDGRGEQVPWRRPLRAARRSVAVRLVDVGRRGGTAVARFANSGVVDSIELSVPDRRFHGYATVLGSDDRRTWTRLSRTEVYAVGGAHPARSTTALVPRSFFRWFEVRVTAVTRIDGARVAALPLPETLLRLPSRFAGSVLDLGYRVPVARVGIAAATTRYSRPFRIETMAGGVVASGVLARDGPAHTTVVPLDLTVRRLRIVVDNGDNPPLRRLRAVAYARRRTLVVEGGHPGPLRVYYGAAVRAPEYDFARLPFHGRMRAASLGPEHANAAYHVADTRGFFARHHVLVTAALAIAAAAVLAAGALALRRT